MLGVHVDRQLQATFPPARVVVKLGDLVETELLVVVRTDPFGGIDGAFFQRRVDVAAGNLLRHGAELGDDLTGEAADTHLQALQVGRGLDLLAEPATHLGAGVAGRGWCDDIRFGIELGDQLLAVAVAIPGIDLTTGHAERDRAVEGKRGILADEVVGSGVRHLNGAVLDRIEHAKRRDDFAGGEHLNLELAAGGFGNALGDDFGGTVDGVQALREAGRQAPLDGRGILSDCRHCYCADGETCTCFFQKGTAFHRDVSSKLIKRIAS
jgi:hypothetical protein